MIYCPGLPKRLKMADEDRLDVADEVMVTSGDDLAEEIPELEQKAETEVGISEFLTPGMEPINGIIKHRYRFS